MSGLAIFLTLAAHGANISYAVNLSGPLESPPNASPGIGTAVVTFDTTGNTMSVIVSFSGLLGTTTASHIHCCTSTPGTGTAMVATTTPTFAGFPLGVTSGTYNSGLLDLTSATSYNPAFITAFGGTTASAEAALLAGIAAGDAYLNIHTTVVPGGEIRGFLVAAVVPEPSAFLLVGATLAGLALLRRRSRINGA